MPQVRGGLGRWVEGGHQPVEAVRLYKKHWAKVRHEELRDEMLKAYGNKCSCCGETEKVFLTLDHLRNDGYLERRVAGNGTVLYMKLKRQGWPQDGYTIACYDCNCGRAKNGGICPHRSLVHAT
jgi:hypothetical protein